MGYFSITPPKKVAGEGYYPGSIIARQGFTIDLAYITDYGTCDCTFSSTVNIYANSPTNDYAYHIGTVYVNRGRGTSSELKISSVYGTGSGRKISVIDSNGVKGSTTVGVWFQGDATYFNGETGSYCEGTGYKNQPIYYAALPAYGYCKELVAVHNPNTGITKTAEVWDVGPFFDAYHCGEDAYWNKGTVPLAQQYEGRNRCDVCESSCSTDNKIINGAIIDLSQELLRDLGGSGTIKNALWRFS